MPRDPDAPSGGPSRLFAAVELPALANEAIDRGIADLRAAHPRPRWVRPEDRHVTLKFLGSTAEPLVAWTEDIVRTVASGQAAIPMVVAGLGAFPNERRARVVWAGIDDPGRGLARLAHALDRALVTAFPVAARPFTAHVTVARSEPPLELAAGWNDVDLRSEPFSAERIILFRSDLRRAAPRYERVAVVPLSG